MDALDEEEHDDRKIKSSRNIHDFETETLQRIDSLWKHKGWEVERLNQQDHAEIFPLEDDDEDAAIIRWLSRPV